LKGDIEGYGPSEPPKPLEGRYYNVCCELHDYKPVPFEEIVKYFENKGY
jgi:calcineurin-like phosphoesterase family protein